MHSQFMLGLGMVAATAAAAFSNDTVAAAPASFETTSTIISTATISTLDKISLLTVDTISPMTTLTTIGVTSTTTRFVTPLPSSEAKKQEVAFRKDQEAKSNSVAAEVKQAFSTQGKEVPSALVPAQPKQTEIKHSGLQNIIDIVLNTDYNHPVAASPENGKFYIAFFNGTNATVADEFADKHNARLPHTIMNPNKRGMCILGHAKHFRTNKIIPFAFNDTKNPQLYVGPNSTVQIGNFIPHTESKNNGRIQARFNCNKDCTTCAGDEFGPVASLVEFNHIHKADGTIFSWFNPSNVDGLHANFNLTVSNGEGVCGSRQCNTTTRHLRTICPKANIWYDMQTFGCRSDCKTTGRDDHCCVGAFDSPRSCPASSGFLHELCSDAYSWAYDDKDHTDTCGGAEKVHMSFWPILYER